MPWPVAVWVCLLLGIVGLGAASCSPSRAIEATQVLGDLAGGKDSTGEQETQKPLHTTVAYQVEQRASTGDLYLPGERAKSALVLVPGLTPQGADDPRLVAFANTLARAQFVVLVPEIQNLRALKLSADDAQVIADAIRHLSERIRAAEQPSVGVVAISYAAGPALLAVQREQVRPHVRFIAVIGGYHDIVAVTTFFTTGYYREQPDEPWRYRPPNEYGKWVFVRSNAERLSNSRDRALLRRIAARKMQNPSAEVGDLAARLGPEGRSVYALLTNNDPDRVPKLIAGLPDAIRSEMKALDLSRQDLSEITARLILVHGRDDPIIPYTESKALADAADGDRVHLYLVDSLAHVDVGPVGLLDAFTMWRAVYNLLGERDAAPPPWPLQSQTSMPSERCDEVFTVT